MEDLPTDQLRQHNACDCIMCNPCLERYAMFIKNLHEYVYYL